MEKELIGVKTMGMSASQVRLLSLTSRMHDLEFQAQGIHYTKLDIANDHNEAYEEYLEATEATKLQMSVVTANGQEFRDVSYKNLVNQSEGIVSAMYAITNAKGQILLPEKLYNVLNQKIDGTNNFPLENLDTFLDAVAKTYVYSGRPELDTVDKRIAQMKTDGNYNYWKSIYYQIVGFKNDEGKFVDGRGIDFIYNDKISDRDWLMEGINNAEVFLYKMESKKNIFEGDKINIFAQTGVAEDQDITETNSDELISEARMAYEKRIKELDFRDQELDLTLSQIDQQHNALKTEYDSVKQIVSKSVERSFKTFNA